MNMNYKMVCLLNNKYYNKFKTTRLIYRLGNVFDRGIFFLTGLELTDLLIGYLWMRQDQSLAYI